MYKFGINERAKYISLACGVTQVKAREMILADSECIKSYLLAGHCINLSGLGFLKPKTIKAKPEREFTCYYMNPVKTITLPPREAYSSIKFRPTSLFKAELKDKTYGNPFNTEYNRIVSTSEVDEDMYDEYEEDDD